MASGWRRPCRIRLRQTGHSKKSTSSSGNASYSNSATQFGQSMAARGSRCRISAAHRGHSTDAGGRLAHPVSPSMVVVWVSGADSRNLFGPSSSRNGATRRSPSPRSSRPSVRRAPGTGRATESSVKRLGASGAACGTGGQARGVGDATASVPAGGRPGVETATWSRRCGPDGTPKKPNGDQSPLGASSPSLMSVTVSWPDVTTSMSSCSVRSWIRSENSSDSRISYSFLSP